MCTYGYGCQALCVCLGLSLHVCEHTQVPEGRPPGWVEHTVCVGPPWGVAAPAVPLKAGLSWDDRGETHPTETRQDTLLSLRTHR